MRNILAIAANTNPTRYVSATSKRFDGKLIVETTENPNDARDYETVAEAESAITRFYNPHERTYTVVPLINVQPAPISVQTDKTMIS